MADFKLVYFLFVLIFLPSSHTYAKCNPLLWPISRTLTLQKIQSEAQKIDKHELIRYIWYELNHPKEKSVAAPLLFEIEQNEYNKLRRQYYKGIGFIAYGKPANEIIKNWPKNRKPKKMDMKFLCENYPAI